MKVLIHLIGGQTAPNFIASEIIKPDINILVYSNGSVAQMKFLKNNFEVSSLEVLVNAYDYKNCIEKCNEIIVKYGLSDEVILNFTGGTKIMSASFLSIFNAKNLISVYINSEENKILYIRGNEFETKKIKVNFSIKKYLALYGHSYKDIKDKPDFRDEVFQRYMEFMAKNFKTFSDFVFDINKNTNNKKINSIPKKFTKSENVFELDESNKVLKLHFMKESIGINEIFEFRDIDKNKLKFISSGWFEQYIFNELVNRNYFDELLLNIEIDFKDKGIKDKTVNEIDILGIKDNKLVIIELKSGGYGQDNINKLKAIKENLGGTYSIPVFITYFPAIPDVKIRIDEYGFKNYTHSRINEFIKYIDSCSKKNVNL